MQFRSISFGSISTGAFWLFPETFRPAVRNQSHCTNPVRADQSVAVLELPAGAAAAIRSTQARRLRYLADPLSTH